MAGRSKYSDSDRAAVYLALEVNDGNIKRTARETGMPIATVRDWKKAWQTDGVPDAVIAATESVTDSYVAEVKDIQGVLLARIRELAPEVKNIREAATAFGILDDKRVRAEGKPTSINEQSNRGLPSPEEVRALIGGWMAGALTMQHEREADIIEVAEEVESAPALNPAPRP